MSLLSHSISHIISVNGRSNALGKESHRYRKENDASFAPVCRGPLVCEPCKTSRYETRSTAKSHTDDKTNYKNTFRIRHRLQRMMPAGIGQRDVSD
jgi:hypothetical protein